jgi:hypothetical protein
MPEFLITSKNGHYTPIELKIEDGKVRFYYNGKVALQDDENGQRYKDHFKHICHDVEVQGREGYGYSVVWEAATDPGLKGITNATFASVKAKYKTAPTKSKL